VNLAGCGENLSLSLVTTLSRHGRTCSGHLDSKGMASPLSSSMLGTKATRSLAEILKLLERPFSALLVSIGAC
jgi:hypothetical protein